MVLHKEANMNFIFFESFKEYLKSNFWIKNPMYAQFSLFIVMFFNCVALMAYEGE